jgi:hypothetical protein
MFQRAINREQINDRGKLLFHRLVARRLGHSPDILNKVRMFVLASCEKQPGRRDALAEWTDILNRDVEDVRRLLVRRDEDMTRLRLSSPFALMSDFVIQDENARRKLWRIAKKTRSVASVPSKILTEQSVQ